MHAELTKYFGIFLDDASKASWPTLLQRAAWWYNTAYHHAIKCSPYEALMGEKASMGPLGIPRHVRDMDDSFEKYYGMRWQQLIQRHKMVQESLKKGQDAMLRYHNKNTFPIKFKIGDYVLYKNNAPNNKWDPKFFGPWKIIDQISPVVFELAMEGRRFSAHATQLKLYKGTIRTPEVEEEREQLTEGEAEPNATEVWVDSATTPDNSPRPVSFNDDGSIEHGTSPTHIQGPDTPPHRSGPWSTIKQKMVNFRKEADQSARRLVVQLQPLPPAVVASGGYHRNSLEAEVLSQATPVRSSVLPPTLRRSTRNAKPVQRLNL
jgi:hypothetical protein